MIDLHSHSTASDGTFAPAAVAKLARESGLSAWALTDHDTVGGIAEAADASRKLGIDFLPGIEISAEYAHPGVLHILGYGIDPASLALTELTRRLIAGRDSRNPRIIHRLQELGIAITMKEVKAEAAGGVVGRPHIAAILVRKGYVGTMKQAFNQYLAPGGQAYFDKERLSPREALEMIRQSGGLPVLAHPIQLRTENDAQLDRVVKDLTDLGLAGIEVIHSDHSAVWVEKCTRLADRFGLLKTGGSDFHGAKKQGIQLGRASSRRIPREFFDELRAALA